MRDITFEPSRAMTSIASWIDQTVASGAPVTADQAKAWALGIRQAGNRYAELERLMRERSADRADRINAEQAEAIVTAALVRLPRLALLAQECATNPEMKQIEQDVTFLIDALETLTLGVVRPIQDNELKGA